jgi:hypothetical protein
MGCITAMRIALKETIMYSHCHLATDGLETRSALYSGGWF